MDLTVVWAFIIAFAVWVFYCFFSNLNALKSEEAH